MTRLTPGDPAPWFVQRTHANPKYTFQAAGGRYLILFFFGSAQDDTVRETLRRFHNRSDVFNDMRAGFFGVTIDNRDEHEPAAQPQTPGFRYFLDFDRAVSTQYEIAPPSDPGQGLPYRRCVIVIDPNVRVLRVFPWTGQAGLADEVADYVAAQPAFEDTGMAKMQAPILVVPRVFEPELCQQLIALYERKGGGDSGFMREVDGKTVGIIDHSFKRRRDCEIEDAELRKACSMRVHRRLVPEIEKAFQFKVTRMERYIVACYNANEGGYFRPHRDNTTKGTAHRRFAVTLSLDSESYTGGDLRFPEYGRQTYRAPTGGCVVFSCSLLHEATPVISGVRYVFLPFLYDDAAAELRERNNVFLGTQVGAYTSGHLQPPAQVPPQPLPAPAAE